MGREKDITVEKNWDTYTGIEPICISVLQAETALVQKSHVVNDSINSLYLRKQKKAV